MATSLRLSSPALLTCLALLGSAHSQAQNAVKPGSEDLSLAGGKLTAFGAERAGNVDGSIPPYEGGITPAQAPAGFKLGSGRYPDPFAAEKPLYVVDAKNMAQYDALLNPGTRAMLQAYPSYKLRVFKSHRTMGYPNWVLKNSIKNTKTASLVADPYGDGVRGAYGGIPFAQPKDGYEAMWNQALRYTGARVDYHCLSYLIDSNGQKSLAGDQEAEYSVPYYDPNGDKLPSWNFQSLLVSTYGPPSQIGLMYLLKYSIDNTDKQDATWVYTTGVRRIRLAPELKYDAPSPSISGAILVDEINGFSGRMDRFDFKLVGKRELLVPYNNYQAMFSDELIGPQHENPEVTRWEKHRVWVVDATLKTGQRHSYSRRTYYIDEDSWSIVLYEAYDKAGGLQRVGRYLTFIPYDKPRVAVAAPIMHDLKSRSYTAVAVMGNYTTYQRFYDDLRPQSRFTPEAVAAQGIR